MSLACSFLLPLFCIALFLSLPHHCLPVPDVSHLSVSLPLCHRLGRHLPEAPPSSVFIIRHTEGKAENLSLLMSLRGALCHFHSESLRLSGPLPQFPPLSFSAFHSAIPRVLSAEGGMMGGLLTCTLSVDGKGLNLRV